MNLKKLYELKDPLQVMAWFDFCATHMGVVTLFFVFFICIEFYAWRLETHILAAEK